MLVQLLCEFVLNYCLIDSNVIGSLIGCDISTLADIIGIASDLTSEVREYNQSRIQQVRRQRVLSVQVLVCETICTRFVDVIFAGNLGEFTTSAVCVLATVVEALAVCTGEPFAIVGRGISTVAILFEANSVLAVVLSLFDIFALALRPVSLSVRIVANLTTGTLLSGLLVANSVTAVIDTLTASTVAGTFVGTAAALTVVIALNGVETFVGVLQVYVFSTLSVAYTVVSRD